MTGECLRVLRIMEKGGRIEARRTYPYPHHFWLVKPDGNRYASGLAESTIDALVTGGYVQAGPPQDWSRDRFDYNITPAGELAARGQSTSQQWEQLTIPGTEAA